MRFLAIDFETSNPNRTSICSVGYALFENGEIIKSGSHLCRPVPFEFGEWNVAVNKITKRMVASLGGFDKVMHYLFEDEYDFMVAHNSDFDIDCLFQTAKHYGLALPETKFICTMHSLARILENNKMNITLSGVCRLLGIDIEHHNAESDAIAAGRLFNHLYSLDNYSSLEDFAKKTGIILGRFNTDSYTPCDPMPFPKPNIYGIKTKDITAPIDPELSAGSPLNGAMIVFTGNLDEMSRHEAVVEACRRGARPQDNITKKTRYLVIGNEFRERYQKGDYSGKMKKAIEYKEAGQEIDILFEENYLELIDLGGAQSSGHPNTPEKKTVNWLRKILR